MQNKPQLPAEMEKRFDAEFPFGVMIEYDEKTDTWEIDVTDEVKHFLATALEEQKKEILAEIEGLVAKVQRKITSKTFEDPNLCLDVMVDIDDSLAELRAKLVEMKEKTI